MQEIHFLRDLSHSMLNSYANKTLVLSGDFNCALTELDKHGGNNLINAHDLIDTCTSAEQTITIYKVLLGAIRQ